MDSRVCGTYATRRLTGPLSVGANTIRISRAQLAEKIDPGNIKFVVFFINGPSQRLTLFFDNLRLEPNELRNEVYAVSPDFSADFSDGSSATMIMPRPPRTYDGRKITG